MRCRNCLTVVGDTDTVCVVCHTPLVSQGAAFTPAARAARRAGLLVTWSRRSPAFKWGCGGLMLIGGCLAILVGAAFALEAKEASQRGPKAMTEAELAKVENPATLHGNWIEYDSPQSIETGTELEYISALKNGKIHSRFVLVRVGKGWMMAEVSPKFAGQHFVGEIKPLSHSPLGEKVLQDIRRRQPTETQTLLPYYLDAVRTYEMGTRSQYLTAGGVAFMGLVFAAFSMKMLLVKRQ
jgi:hypothetical protein